MDEKKRIAAAIRDYLARERISREQFAFKTKLGKSTVDKLLIGLFSDKTLAIVENHTKLALRSRPEHLPEPSPRATVGEAARPVLRPLDQPSIAVLPFTNLSGDPEQDYLSDGITEDVITALARLRWLFVIARNSTFVYKNRAVDVRQVARDLGVRYVLEGSVRTAGRHVRVTGQLIDAESGKHIWADRYDRELQDIFVVQDDITEQVVAAVEPHLYAQEGFRAASKQPDSINAWGLRRPRLEHAEQGRAQAEPGSADLAPPGDCHGADLCQSPRPSRLGCVVGRALLLVCGYARRLSAGSGTRATGALI